MGRLDFLWPQLLWALLIWPLLPLAYWALLRRRSRYGLTT